MVQTLEDIKGKDVSEAVINELVKGKNGAVIANVENVVRVFQSAPKFKNYLRYDEWTGKLYILDGDKWRDFRDSDYVKVQRMLSLTIQELAKIPKQTVIDAISSFMDDNKEDTAIDYIRSLKWDGKKRLDKFIHRVYGTPDTNYHSAVGANFFKGMVARIVNPGVKFDTVLCIEGVQGIGKSRSIEMICGSMNHLETTVDPESKDFLMQMRGHLIVEFTEGVIMRKKDAANLKGFVSKKEDVFRSPYGVITNTVPRRCVFAMTTNNSEYLKDSTGNRRFLPIYATKIDLALLRTWRDQFFAEALHRYEVEKETLYEYPEGIESIQKDKMIKSPHYDIVDAWCQNPHALSEAGNEMSLVNTDINGGFTIMDIWIHCLHNRTGGLKKWDEQDIADILTDIGYEKIRNRINGIRAYRWYRLEKIKDGYTFDDELSTVS